MDLRILELIKGLKTRPAMYMPYDKFVYKDFQNYLLGYFEGIRTANGRDLEREISEWYQDRAKVKGSNMVWFCQFELNNKSLDNDELVEIFFDELILYFESRQKR